MKLLSFFYPELPPSSNKLYVRARHGGLVLSSKGEKYKRSLSSFLDEYYLEEFNNLPMGNSYIFRVRIILYLEAINKGFPSKTNEMYKTIDTDNRVKLLLDILQSKVANDKYFFEIVVSKYHSTTNQGIAVTLELLNPADYGIPLSLLTNNLA